MNQQEVTVMEALSVQYFVKRPTLGRIISDKFNGCSREESIRCESRAGASGATIGQKAAMMKFSHYGYLASGAELISGENDNVRVHGDQPRNQ